MILYGCLDSKNKIKNPELVVVESSWNESVPCISAWCTSCGDTLHRSDMEIWERGSYRVRAYMSSIQRKNLPPLISLWLDFILNDLDSTNFKKI